MLNREICFGETYHATADDHRIWDDLYLDRDVPEFVCEYTLSKIINAIYNWYQADEQARIVDSELDRLEDSIAEKYYQCMTNMGS